MEEVLNVFSVTRASYHRPPLPSRYPSRDDWDLLRPFITQWYKHQTVLQMVARLKCYNLSVTEKMVRDRLRQWSLYKNKRPSRCSRETTLQSYSRRPSVITGSSSATEEASSGSTPGILLTPSSGKSFMSSTSHLYMTPPEGSPCRVSGDHFIPEHGIPPPTGVDATDLDEWTIQDSVARPLPIPREELGQRGALTGVHHWFELFLESADSDWDIASTCPMSDLMRTFQDAFYLIDTGANEHGHKMLNQAGETVSSVLRAQHPMAFLHAVQGLTARRLSSQKLGPTDDRPEQYELAVMLNGTLRVIECDGCDAPIVDSHYHCKICYAGQYDICLSCIGQGVHCLHGDHWLVKRLIEDGAVVETTSDSVPPQRMRRKNPTRASGTSRDPGARRPLFYANERGTSCEVLPIVVAFLSRIARDTLGLYHPMSLLLGMFQTAVDMETLQHRIVALMDSIFIHRITREEFLTAHLQLTCGWILFQQGRYNDVEHFLTNLPGIPTQDPIVQAEEMRLLAATRIEQGRSAEAASLYQHAWITLCQAGSESTPQADRVLHDSATLAWQLGNLEECEVTIDLARKNLLTVDRASPKDRRYVLTFCNMFYMRCRRYEEAAALRDGNLDVFLV